MASALKICVAVLALAVSVAAITTKQFTTTDGTTYTYEYAPSRNGFPTVLLIHGFPSTRSDWDHQTHALSEAGFGIIAPDTLGSGESDKPAELAAYRSKRQANHLAELLDHEDLDQVLGVGHDWGSDLLSRTYVWHPHRFYKLAFLSVGYVPPGIPIDLDAINAESLESLGYARYGYWYFFYSFDAGQLISEHLESFYHSLYASNNTAVAWDFAHIGALRRWLLGDTVTSLAEWDTQEHKDTWMSSFSQPKAPEAALSPYKRSLAGGDVLDEAKLGPDDIAIKVPVLLIGSIDDMLTPGENMASSTEPFARNGMEEHQLGGGHWIMMENAEEVSSILIDFARFKSNDTCLG